MKLLFLVNNAAFFLSHRLPLALAAREAGYEVHVATPPGPKVAKVESLGFAWHEVPMTRSGMHPVEEGRTLAELVRLFRRVRPDLVHNVTPKAVLYGGLAARAARVPCVVHALTGLGYAFGESQKEGLLSRVLGVAFRTAFGHSNMKVIFQNEDDRKTFLGRGWVDREQAVLIPGSGVDVETYRPLERDAGAEQGEREEKKSPPEGKAPVVLFASRLLRSKGVPEYVEAAKLLKARGVPATFLLAGVPDEGNPETVTEAELTHWASEGAIEYVGHVEDMPALFQRSDIACLPTYYREGVPKFLIEAGACGLPSVTTNVPGCRDLVQDGVTGIVVEPRNGEALAAALKALLEDRALRERLGEAARARVVAGYSVERVNRATLATYAEVCSARG